MSTNEKYVLFKAVGQLLACPLASIDEVVDPVSVTELPNTAEWFHGIASRKGSLLPVSDLGAYVSNKPSKNYSSAKWLLVTSQHETIALTVDDVVGLSSEDDATLQVSSNESSANQPLVGMEAMTELVKGQISVSGESVYLVDLAALLEHERFTSIGVSL